MMCHGIDPDDVHTVQCNSDAQGRRWISYIKDTRVYGDKFVYKEES